MKGHPMHIDDLLREASQRQASDLYLCAGAVPCISVEGVYYAVQSAEGQRLSPETTMELAHQVMNKKQWEDFKEELEANLAYMAEGCGRFRVNAFWQRGSVALVCRRVEMKIPTLRQLGLPPNLRNIALADRGIVLVTGSTGSGKSTTLASMIDYRAHLRTGHIVTIEDPVEFIYTHRRSIVTQREVGIDTASFHEALKNSLRQAPQVICLGEMRDAETVQFAMHASETGHLVLATLHSTNAVLAIERILNFYPGHMQEQMQKQLALNLKAVICQRLVHGVKGGRHAATELLIDTPRIRDLIGKGQLGSVKEALSAENQEGVHNFDRSLYKLCKQKKITHEEALQAAESANDLQLKFRGIGIAPGSSWEDISDPWQQIGDDFELPAGMTKFAKKDRLEKKKENYSNEDVPKLSGYGKSMHLSQDERRIPGGERPEESRGPNPERSPSAPRRPEAPPAAPPRAAAPKAPPGTEQPGAGPPPPTAPPHPPDVPKQEDHEASRKYKIFHAPRPGDIDEELD